MNWLIVVVAAVLYVASIFAGAWILSYNGVRDAQRPQVRERMPRGSAAFWRWLTRRRTEGTEPR